MKKNTCCQKKKKKCKQTSERMWFTGKRSLYTGSRQSWRHFTSNWEIASCHISAVIPIKEQVCSSLACKSLFTEMGARLKPLNWQINKHKEKWKHSSGKHLVPNSNYKGWCSSNSSYAFFTISTVIALMEKPFKIQQVLKNKLVCWWACRNQIS